MLSLAIVQQVPTLDCFNNYNQYNNILFSQHTPSLALAYIKIYYAILIGFALKSCLCNTNRSQTVIGQFVMACSYTIKNKSDRALCAALVWTSLLNFLLIAIVNPSLLNPGPSNLSVFYQNVQGLIPFGELGQAHPKLDQNKLLEFQAHLSQSKPGLIVINETWLKPSILNNEIIPSGQYNIFRNARPARPNSLRMIRSAHTNNFRVTSCGIGSSHITDLLTNISL